MPGVDSQKMLTTARSANYAIGAFNMTSFLDMVALLEASEEKKSPLIIQTTQRVAEFLDPKVIIALFAELAKNATVPVGLHLDHCTDVDFVKKCAKSGYTSVMFDGSYAEFEDNIRKTSEIVAYCHRYGIYVEGELGTIGGREDPSESNITKPQLCDPEKALEFIQRTNIDWFAPAIGTLHGLYKTTNPVIDFHRLEKIQTRLKSKLNRTVPLVIHGGTGIPEPSVRNLISSGASKFNVGTDLKKAKIDAIFTYIAENRFEYLPEKINPLAKQAVKSKAMEWMDRLGSANRVHPDASL